MASPDGYLDVAYGLEPDWCSAAGLKRRSRAGTSKEDMPAPPVNASFEGSASALLLGARLSAKADPLRQLLTLARIGRSDHRIVGG